MTMGMKRMAVAAIVCVAAIAPWSAGQQRSKELTRLVAEAEALAPIAKTDASRDWLAQVEHLPEIEPRWVFRERTAEVNRVLSQRAFDATPRNQRAGLKRYKINSGTYYATRYGTPLAYIRALDLAARAHGEGWSLRGKRIFDLGYGQIGQLRLLAMCGAEVVGSDVDPLLEATYSEPTDTGVVTGGATDGSPAASGSITLAHGVWPGDTAIRRTVGDGFDVILARNVLKRGFIRPTAEVAPWTQVDLGVPDVDVPAALLEALAPGGVLVVYNIGGRPHPERYIPSVDIADPWSEAEWKVAGFEVISHNVDETEATRAMARALGWADHPYNMEIEDGLFGTCTLLRRPKGK